MTRLATVATVIICMLPEQAYAQRPLFASAPGSPVTVGPGSGQVALADIDRDGHLDMITRHLLSRTVSVSLGNGKGGFTPAPGGDIRLNYQLGAIALGDVNNDGIPDLAVTSSDRDSVDVFLGNGKGGFSLAPGSPFTASPSTIPYTRGICVVDINEDGNLDIVTTDGDRNVLSILFGNGRGGFSRGPVVTLALGSDHSGFAFGDVDGDGHIDVVTASHAEEGFQRRRA